MMSYFWGVIFDSRINIRFLPSNVRFCGVIPLRSDIISARSLVENHWILLNLEKDYILNIVHLLIFFSLFSFLGIKFTRLDGTMSSRHRSEVIGDFQVLHKYFFLYFTGILLLAPNYTIILPNV